MWTMSGNSTSTPALGRNLFPLCFTSLSTAGRPSSVTLLSKLTWLSDLYGRQCINMPSTVHSGKITLWNSEHNNFSVRSTTTIRSNVSTIWQLRLPYSVFPVEQSAESSAALCEWPISAKEACWQTAEAESVQKPRQRNISSRTTLLQVRTCSLCSVVTSLLKAWICIAKLAN
jgi:hypothetical protein